LVHKARMNSDTQQSTNALLDRSRQTTALGRVIGATNDESASVLQLNIIIDHPTNIRIPRRLQTPTPKGVADFVTTLRHDAIPPKVIARIKLLILDSLG
jgi:hypothetical protein